LFYLFCLIAGHLCNNEPGNKADRHGERYQYNLGHTHFPEEKPYGDRLDILDEYDKK
jgi:hypothetical protein